MRTFETREVPQPETAESPESGPKYPYGLEITLEGEALDKMPALADMGVQEVVHIEAKGFIKASRAEEMLDGDVRRTVEIQIVTLGIAPDDAEAAFNEREAGPGRPLVDSSGKKEGRALPPQAPGFGGPSMGGGAP